MKNCTRKSNSVMSFCGPKICYDLGWLLNQCWNDTKSACSETFTVKLPNDFMVCSRMLVMVNDLIDPWLVSLYQQTTLVLHWLRDGLPGEYRYLCHHGMTDTHFGTPAQSNSSSHHCVTISSDGFHTPFFVLFHLLPTHIKVFYSESRQREKCRPENTPPKCYKSPANQRTPII